MTSWFGDSWGAPCCDPKEQVTTPVGLLCAACEVPIQAGDQGFMVPSIEVGGRAGTSVWHHGCLMRAILPHGAECKHCRGADRELHARRCNYRQTGGECNCIDVEDV